jgi:uncharacterized membrane protein YvbJ
MFCPQCGQSVKDGSQFCSGCGKATATLGTMSERQRATQVDEDEWVRIRARRMERMERAKFILPFILIAIVIGFLAAFYLYDHSWEIILGK